MEKLCGATPDASRDAQSLLKVAFLNRSDLKLQVDPFLGNMDRLTLCDRNSSNVVWELRQANRAFCRVGDGHGAFDYILQLANVTRPSVTRQGCESFVIDLAH